MLRLDIAFLLLSVVCFIAGICLGIYMGIIHDFQLTPVHVHINLLGWTSLALFGLVYRLYPRAARLALAKVHFWLAAPSALTFPAGIYIAIIYQDPLLAIISAFCWLTGVVAFFFVILMLAFSPHLQEARDW